MPAGQYRHRVELQSATDVQNTLGEPAPTWATDATVWAAIKPISGQERVQAQQLAAEVTHLIRTRYGATVTADMRIVFGERVFEILSHINVGERNKELEIMCKEQP